MSDTRHRINALNKAIDALQNASILVTQALGGMGAGVLTRHGLKLLINDLQKEVLSLENESV